MLDNFRLLQDSDVSQLLSMSESWVRKQRFNFRHGLPHILTIEPVMIGSSPRYRVADVEAWLASQYPSGEGRLAGW